MGSATSIKDDRRYIPAHDLCSPLLSITCEIILTFHALTGSVTTYARFGIGKKLVYKLIKSSSVELSDILKLKYQDLKSSMCVASKIVFKLYDP